MINIGEQDQSPQNETENTEKRKPGPLDEKEKIRARYAGTDGVTLIPARLQPGLLEDMQEKRVAVYARVSTGDPRQTSSYELQKNHYQDVVNRHPGWKLAGIYADEGISGTSLQHREAFVRMIDDCREHKIDLILTKSVSRFARNVLDCIGYARELAALDPPIGILFEAENIYTLDRNSEMSLSFVSTLAQEESHNKSEVMNASIEMRFRRGIFLTPPLLGYDWDEDGALVVNEEEAKTVRLIFYMYLYVPIWLHLHTDCGRADPAGPLDEEWQYRMVCGKNFGHSTERTSLRRRAGPKDLDAQLLEPQVKKEPAGSKPILSGQAPRRDYISG